MLAFGPQAVAAPPSAPQGTPAGPDQVKFVELYTSEACASCLPAEAAFASLADRQHVVALSFHVGYWNYLGWTDRFALHAADQRQWDYAHRWHSSDVFTPELIVDGMMSGGAAPAEIGQMMKKAKPIPELHLARKQNHIVVDVPALPQVHGAVLWVAAFDHERVVDIGQGENAGHVVREVNVVRFVAPMATLDHAPAAIAVPSAALEGHRGIAAFVQEPGAGPVAAAGMLLDTKPPPGH